MRRWLVRALLLVLFPIILGCNVAVTLWQEIKGIPFYVWCDVRQDWSDFVSAWRRGSFS